MSDVVDKFFAEDLTEAEEKALEEVLWSSDEHAQRFGRMAEEAYARYGLPDPSTSAPGAGGPSLGTLSGWGVAVLVIVGIVLYCLRDSPVAPPAPVPEVVAPVVQPKPAVSRPKPRPKPAVVAPVQQAPSFNFLKVVVQQDSMGPVVVRVLSPAGQEVRRMYDGTLAAGQWAFRWDGKLADGVMAKPGTYTIEINNGRSVQSRKVLVQ